MRIIVGTGVGMAIGLMCLVQVLGWSEWCPPDIFRTIHAPALFLATLFGNGESGWSFIPIAMVSQWLVVGAIAGFALHHWHASKHPGSRSDRRV